MTDPSLRRMVVERTARVYELGGEAGAGEVWFLLHGYGQLAAKFLPTFRPASSPTRLLVAPEALNHYYTDHDGRKVGATWMTSEDRETEIADYVRYLDRVHDDVLARAPGAKVEIHGFSQGCATAARWVALGRATPARIVLWGGALPPDPPIDSYRDRLDTADLTLVFGDRDQYLGEPQVAEQAARLDAAGVRYTLRRFSGGHVIPWPVLEQLATGG